MVTIPNCPIRRAVQDAPNHLRARRQGPLRKLQALARLPSRTPRTRSQQSLRLRNPKQHFRKSPSHNAQDAADLAYVPAEPDGAEIDHQDPPDFRPSAVCSSLGAARPRLGALPCFQAAERLASVLNDDEFCSLKGKTKQTLWLEYCDLLAKHATDVLGFDVDAIIRCGIKKVKDEVGRLWTSLAEYYIKRRLFEKARDVFEEAMQSVVTV
ncbi:hypothetical protein ACLB2K_024825 [Fragaria x ananassa]